MFAITRVAAQITKFQRSLVKGVAKEKINLKNAPELDEFYQGAVEAGGAYKKNIFSRMFAWVKAFRTNFKNIKESLKEGIKEFIDEGMGKKEAKKFLIEAAQDLIKNLKTTLKHTTGKPAVETVA